MTRLSSSEICSFVGDILPIRLIGDEGKLRSSDIKWESLGDSISIRVFDNSEYAFPFGALIILLAEGEGDIDFLSVICTTTPRKTTTRRNLQHRNTVKSKTIFAKSIPRDALIFQ